MLSDYTKEQQYIILMIYVAGYVSDKKKGIDISPWRSEFLTYEFERVRLSNVARMLHGCLYDIETLVNYLLSGKSRKWGRSPTRLRRITNKAVRIVWE